MDQAQANIAAIAGQLERAYPQTNEQMGLAVFSLTQSPFSLKRSLQSALAVLMAAVAVVLLIACGKSTLINAIVGQAVLPVGVVPVTSVVTIVRYGRSPAACVRFAAGHTQDISIDVVAAFVDERQNPGYQRGAALVEILLPASILRGGL